MIFKAYYDSSGRIKDPKTQFLTLAGYAGTAECWKDLESKWRGTLIKHNAPRSSRGFPYFHMREAIVRQRGYRGWSEERLRELWRELMNLIGHTDRSTLVGFSATVDVKGFRAATAKLPKMKSPDDLLIDFAFGQALSMLPSAADVIELVFDKDEKFAGRIGALRGGSAWWSKYVSDIREENMHESCGIQAADTLAWMVNRYYSRGNNDRWGMYCCSLFLIKDQVHLLFDEQTLLNCLDQHGRYKIGKHLPKASINFPELV